MRVLRRPPRVRTVALLDWTQLIEDYLDNINVSFEDFCNEMNGGWMFGYIAALQTAGVRTVLFCVSARVQTTSYFTHAGTGAVICVLPAPGIYRMLRRRLVDPYGATVEEAVGSVNAAERLLWGTLKALAPYLSSPMLTLSRELRRERCDALICQDYEHGRFDLAVLLGQLIRLPVFATFQGGSPAAGRLESALRRSVVKFCNGLIVGAEAEFQRLSTEYGLTKKKLAQIPNPIDVSEWQPRDKNMARAQLTLPNSAVVVIWHGRVDFRRKGLDVLLNAWETVYRERPDCDLRLLIIGTGSEADQLRREIDQRQLPGLTWLDQYISNRELVRTYLSAADIYAFPSRHEGFPVAPLEAMACGLPIVSAKANGMTDVLAGGETGGGILVPCEDADAFASALGRLIDDPTLRGRLGKSARRRIEEKFSLAAVGSELRAFLGSNV